ncbi:TPA: glycosyltransferase, partial [Escherichia coli]|nr:glycosyltransferase [Escherichia coli]
MNPSSCASAWVDILLVNYNGGAQILDTIASIHRHSAAGSYRITVVDNGSSDESCDQIERLYPDTQVLRTGSNNGFGKGCNIGARHTQAPNILLLNPDAQLLTNVIEIFQQYLAGHAANPQPILGGLSVDAQGKPSYAYERFPTPATLMLKALGLGRLLEPSYAHREPHPVDYVSGSLLLIGRREFERLGGFDEAFFLYFEETDLQYRAREQGIASIHVPAARYLHESGGTFTDASFRGRCYSDGMKVYLDKRYGRRGRVLHRLYHLIHGALQPVKTWVKKR